jgi:hypothetical protein
MADTLTTIITSAAVSAIVLSASAVWNSWRERRSRVSLQQMQENHQAALRDLDRKHEADLRALDRQQEAALRDLDRRHESRLQELADQRELRDLKVERLRTNLVTLTDAALKLGDREFELRMDPLRFTDPDPAFEQARKRLSEVRSVLVLDAESERLLRSLVDLMREYDAYLLALDNWKTQTELAKAAIVAGPGMPPPSGAQEAFHSAQERADRLRISMNEVIDSARETLDAIEQPIVEH